MFNHFYTHFYLIKKRQRYLCHFLDFDHNNYSKTFLKISTKIIKLSKSRESNKPFLLFNY